ncbi:MAG: response regulator [Candidatus Latescibacteria bacterium]|nr:response regulator [Candidatus Latescibacterota bacterium]
MTWNWNSVRHWTWLRYVVAFLAVAVAALLRIKLLGSLDQRAPWLTFYPAVMIAALYGGLAAGLLATVLCCLTIFYLWPLFGPLPFIKDSADWLGMAVFFLNCIMISAVAEAMRRAQVRAKVAREQAEAANQAKSVFLSSMSHELRTPLNAILGFSSLMRNEAGLSDEQRHTLGIINRSGEHLLSLINDVLDMSKIEAGHALIEAVPLNLGEMVADITGLMRPRAAEQGLQLDLDPASDFPPYIRADAVKLRQVLVNLVGNAVKYTLQGTVTLRLNLQPVGASGQPLLVIEVADTGIGIPAADQERIFAPFVQLHAVTTQKGTGLGLAITRQHVELMGGRISVQSSPDKGSLFRVELPVEVATPAELPATRVEQLRVIGLAEGQPVHRVLIVEDQVENWLLLRRLLEGAGFEVQVAENGAAGVERFQAWRPHFIWMDIRMPLLDGMEATRQIRALPGGKEVKIAAITASVYREERDAVMAAGMDDFVRKPFQPAEIFDCLARHLGVQYRYAAAPLATGAAPEPPVPAQALAALPADLRRALVSALISLDGEQISRSIGPIAALDPALGKQLAQQAGHLQYSALLQAAQAAEEATT